MTMFDVDVKGLAELEGGKEPWRLAMEPIANVFDEFRGYVEGRKRPTHCTVTLERSESGRGHWLTVSDDGAGFASESDIWTLFGSTPKRSAEGVAGRFNAGDKQLVAAAREADVYSNEVTVSFRDGVRKVRRGEFVAGVTVRVLMRWTLEEAEQVRTMLRRVVAPAGLRYSVDGVVVAPPYVSCRQRVALPTVAMVDGVLRPSTRKAYVEVIPDGAPTLYELGVPVCDIGELGFPASLNVLQKVPVGLSRDSVSTAYLARLIGSVIESAALDGKRILTDAQADAPFVRMALDWVREPEALRVVVEHLYGDEAVRQSSDALANANAVATGATLISGRCFTPDTRRRLDAAAILPTASAVFPGSAQATADALAIQQSSVPCPRCAGSGRIPK